MEWFVTNHVWQGLVNLMGSCRLAPRKRFFLMRSFREYEYFFRRLRRRFGDSIAFSTLKEVERRVESLYVIGDPPLKPSYKGFKVWCKTDKRGIPLRLRGLSRLTLYKRVWARSVAFILCGRYRAEEGFKLSWKFPKSELTTSSWTFDYKAFKRGLQRLTERFNLRRFRVRGDELLSRDVWIGTASPIHKVSTDGACWDAKVLLENSDTLQALGDLYDAVVTRCTRSPSGGLSGWVSWLRRLSDAAVPRRFTASKPAALARFMWIADRGGKARGVTPLNFHIQSFLLPIHRYFMALLRAIKQDCTFDERSGLFYLEECTRRNVSGSSFDLPAATTQFPLEIMARVVSFFLGRDAAESWFKVMRLPIFFPGVGFRSFARGAPMGFYCMWPVFTLAHHAIVQMAYEKVCWQYNIPVRHFKSYVLRGDDNYTADSDVSRVLYKIWVDINQPPDPIKSLLSWNAGPGVAKFAKRTYSRGSCFQSMTFAELRSAMIFEPLALIELYPLIKGWFSDQPGIHKPGYVTNLFLSPCGNPERIARGCRKVQGSLEVSAVSNAVPAFWREVVPPIDLSVENISILHDIIDTACRHNLASRAGRLCYQVTGVRVPGFVGLFVPDDLERVDVYGPSSRIGRQVKRSFTHVIPELPLYQAVNRLVDRISDLSDFVLGGPASYAASLAIRALREMEGMTQTLRSQTRKHGRLELISRFQKLKRREAIRLHASEWEVISDDPLCYGRWIKLDGISSTLVMKSSPPPGWEDPPELLEPPSIHS